jgi:hypothetical protein
MIQAAAWCCGCRREREQSTIPCASTKMCVKVKLFMDVGAPKEEAMMDHARWTMYKSNADKKIALALLILVGGLSSAYAVTKGPVCTTTDSPCLDIKTHTMRTCRTTTCLYPDRPPTSGTVVFRGSPSKNTIGATPASPSAGAKMGGNSSGGSNGLTTTTTARPPLTSPGLLGGSGTGSAAATGSKAKLPTSGGTTAK